MKTKSFVILVCMLMIAVNLSYLSTADNNSVENDMIQFKQVQSIHFKNSDMVNEKTLSVSYASLNNPPNTPSQPSGPTSVTVGYWYLYTTVTTDPDGDNISYGWDGGDGIVNYWTGYYPSGIICQVYPTFRTFLRKTSHFLNFFISQ